MGRKKPGKPRRARNLVPRQYTLQELHPPGGAYDEWYNVQPGMSTSGINDSRLGQEARDMMHRLARLGPLYGSQVPQAALLLDMVIDTGHLPIMEGDDGTATLIPVGEIAASRTEMSESEVRDSLHNLHANGAFLVLPDSEHDVSLIRFVAKKPEEPGETWHFMGDPDVAVRTVCLTDDMWNQLPSDVAATVAFIRSHDAQLSEPDPKVYGTHEGVNGTEHARELFAAARASGFVDYRGCSACPAGHLCTRSDI